MLSVHGTQYKTCISRKHTSYALSMSTHRMVMGFPMAVLCLVGKKCVMGFPWGTKWATLLLSLPVWMYVCLGFWWLCTSVLGDASTAHAVSLRSAH